MTFLQIYIILASLLLMLFIEFHEISWESEAISQKFSDWFSNMDPRDPSASKNATMFTLFTLLTLFPLLTQYSPWNRESSLLVLFAPLQSHRSSCDLLPAPWKGKQSKSSIYFLHPSPQGQHFTWIWSFPYLAPSWSHISGGAKETHVFGPIWCKTIKDIFRMMPNIFVCRRRFVRLHFLCLWRQFFCRLSTTACANLALVSNLLSSVVRNASSYIRNV